jgi:hypothetical protein
MNKRDNKSYLENLTVRYYRQQIGGRGVLEPETVGVYFVEKKMDVVTLPVFSSSAAQQNERQRVWLLQIPKPLPRDNITWLGEHWRTLTAESEINLNVKLSAARNTVSGGSALVSLFPGRNTIQVK